MTISVHQVSSEMGSPLEEKICSLESTFFPFRVISNLQDRLKLFLTELLPLESLSLTNVGENTYMTPIIRRNWQILWSVVTSLSHETLILRTLSIYMYYSDVGDMLKCMLFFFLKHRQGRLRETAPDILSVFHSSNDMENSCSMSISLNTTITNM